MTPGKSSGADLPVERGYDNWMYRPRNQEFYDHSDFYNFGYWSSETKSAKHAAEQLVDRLAARVPGTRGRILDVACGMGATTRHLARRFDASDIVGINVSRKQLRTAAGNAPGSRFVAMDATRLAFADSSFDNIICVEAAFHFKTRPQFLREAWRVLKPGGTLVLSDILVRRRPIGLRKGREIPENVVNGLDHYRQMYVRAGYDNVEIVDATQECWKSFYRHMKDWGWAKRRAGEIGAREMAAGILFWTMADFVITRYLLVSATKR